jgi:hypothetical protein
MSEPSDLAYQGEYRMQGIPGFSSLQSGTSSKTITALDLSSQTG